MLSDGVLSKWSLSLVQNDTFELDSITIFGYASIKLVYNMHHFVFVIKYSIIKRLLVN